MAGRLDGADCRSALGRRFNTENLSGKAVESEVERQLLDLRRKSLSPRLWVDEGTRELETAADARAAQLFFEAEFDAMAKVAARFVAEVAGRGFGSVRGIGCRPRREPNVPSWRARPPGAETSSTSVPALWRPT